jgi:hypothetical protein
MLQMRAASNPVRFAWAAVFALLLALRLIGATGYMPAVERGGLTIIVCPDADVNAPLALGMHHHHHQGPAKHDHNICPYAAAGALGALGPDWAPLLSLLLFTVALVLGRSFLLIRRQATRDRPPAIGPPIPA